MSFCLFQDALSAWRWLKKEAEGGRIDGDQLFVFGRSLGGAVAIALAAELQQLAQGPYPRGLILENTFTSISDVVNALFPLLAFESLKKHFLRIKWESIQRVPDLEVPMLFLTGEKDEMIPPAHSRMLHARAEKSRLRRNVVFPDGQHNDTWEKGGDEYWKVQATFLQASGHFFSVCWVQRHGEMDHEGFLGEVAPFISTGASTQCLDAPMPGVFGARRRQGRIGSSEARSLLQLWS
ncbi:unnamed protein product [Durusdinium trenchii]|uniref:Alpha/beta hydrolase fold-3 domain-containing protein n=1 Tax=Durusdinium trenchii TaxID=1381693 RepID=A0ABP0NNW0_9DINO